MSAKRPAGRLSDPHNDRFEAYYRRALPWAPGEWAAFVAALEAPLPVTFRVDTTALAGALKYWDVTTEQKVLMRKALRF